MRKIIQLVALLMISPVICAQSISPDRGTKESRIYRYQLPDGTRYYASKPPASGSYQAIGVTHIVQTGRYRINGLLCATDCIGEAQGFRNARDKGIKKYADCPREPQLEALGCSLWVLEQTGQAGT
jgi:hypothetical protein